VESSFSRVSFLNHENLLGFGQKIVSFISRKIPISKGTLENRRVDRLFSFGTEIAQSLFLDLKQCLTEIRAHLGGKAYEKKDFIYHDRGFIDSFPCRSESWLAGKDGGDGGPFWTCAG
jgi:hypothetical protein